VPLILKRRECISFIYSKTIVIDIAISFEKWRGSQLVFWTVVVNQNPNLSGKQGTQALLFQKGSEKSSINQICVACISSSYGFKNEEILPYERTSEKE
jgi:hypothetical protein